MPDEHNVTWEYSNCASYGSGHVAINHTGYFGIKYDSANHYGYTGISQITASFSGSGELWLLKSFDGTTWSEEKMLESGEPVTGANNWRYIRFYNYSETNNPISVSSIRIDYSCVGLTSSEDVDLARASNVLSATDLNYADEFSDLSPRGNSSRALRFTKKESAGDTSSDISFGAIYTLEDIRFKKIEFDYYHVNNYKPIIQLINSEKAVGASQNYSGTKSVYKLENINSNWWHIEIAVFALAPTILKSGKGWDTAIPLDTEVTGIRLTNGTCIIDNLRLSSKPSSTNAELGAFNNTNSMNVDNHFWFKIAWVGSFHSCVYTFTCSGGASVYQINPADANGSPFYFYATATGSVVVHATLVVGYNRQTVTIDSASITINP